MKSLALVYNYFSHFTYYCHIWGNTFYPNLNKIFILQKKCVESYK